MSWTITWPASANIDTVAPELKALAEKYAAASMTALTLQRVGGAEITVRPDTLPRVDGWYGTWGAFSTFLPGTFNPSAYDLKRWVFRPSTKAIRFRSPVAAVTEVRVGGVVLDSAAYRIEGSYLVRIDGEEWPVDDDGFTITYRDSWPVDDMGAAAAGYMAVEWLQLLGASNRKCRLPSSVTNVVRQGLTMEITRGMFPDGVTGIPEIDGYLMLWNPHSLKVRPRVYSPDLPAHRQVRW